MIDYHSSLVSALETVLPTHYEMTITSETETPCITYMELHNGVYANGDTIGYSNLQYQIKVWDNSIGKLQFYATQIDDVLRPLGWTRSASTELYDNNSTMIQKIMTYDAMALEEFKGGLA